MRSLLSNSGQAPIGDFFDFLSVLIPLRRNTLRQYLYVLTLTTAAFGIRLLIAPIDGGIQYVTFFPAVALSAVIGGLGPGLFSALLGAIAATYMFWPPYQSMTFEFKQAMVTSNLVFLFDALLVCSAIEAMHRFYRKSVDAEESQRLAASVFHNSAEGVIITDAGGTILSVNPAFTQITGYTAAEALGRNPSLLRSDRHGPEFYRSMWNTLTFEGHWQGEVWNRRKDGEAYLEWLTINRIEGSHGVLSQYVAVFHDITESRRKDEHIQHLAFHDALTGLPNRYLMQDRLEHALARAHRESGRLSVTFIDLDRFKEINDELGHNIGDLLLQEAAKRLQSRVRAADTVARLGGDEFVVLMEDLQSSGDCACLAQELMAEIARPMQLDGHTVVIGASMGMAFYPEDGTELVELMKRADVAMYSAKAAGRNSYRFFQPSMLDQANQRLSLERDLRRAVAQSEFVLHYQPKLCVSSLSLCGAEALIRWQHPERGLLPPGQFIPLAEETSLIIEIGEWVIRNACQQVVAWQDQGLKLRRVAVNLSAIQLESDTFVDSVERILHETGLRPEFIEFELTESMVMRNPDRSLVTLNRLHQLGIRLALDDFGTGYSSLSYLKHLPVDTLKIDRSFVEGVPDNDGDAQIVRMIVALAKSVGLEVVAEGIETVTQRDFLMRLGCEFLQGYLIARPLPAEDYGAMLGSSACNGCPMTERCESPWSS